MSGEPPTQSATWTPVERKWTTTEKGEEPPFDFVALSYNVFHELTVLATDDDQPYLRERREMISSTFRNNRILREIEEWNPDVVALQELDFQFFGSQWLPRMASLGYAGHLAEATGPWFGGSTALFYKTSEFQLKEANCCPMEELINEQLPDMRAEFQLVRDAKVSERVVNFVRLLHRKTKRQIQLACIHTLWTRFQKPLYQCFEILAVLRKLEALAEKEACMVLGDFNHRPCDPQYELLAQKRISPSSESLLSSEISMDEALLGKMVKEKLKHNLTLSSVYAEQNGEEPKFTHYVFEDAKWLIVTLDYIWYSKNRNLRLVGVLNFPSESDVSRYGGIPSSLFPSDHLPIAAKFKFASDS